MDIETLKTRVIEEVDRQFEGLSELALKIHSNPELGFNEFKASGWLTEYLERNGFSVQRGTCGMPTAFRADYGRGKPAVAILAEYDALPELGHACGHNIIAGSAVGAGVASRLAVDQCQGMVAVIGTPAEELHGGKVTMAKHGAFNNFDAAMMVHPGTRDHAITRALACQNLDVEFFGRAAHAAARPEDGINALEAMILSFNAINSLRQHIKSTARIHGIITDGGDAANIVPAHSAGTFIVRADDDAYLDELKQRVLDCFTGAATATGVRLEYRWADTRYAPMRNNPILAQLFANNMEKLGRRTTMFNGGDGFGSTDMGNVSQIVPGIHPSVAIASRDIPIHSPEFALAAASEAGIKGMLDAAKALAMTVVDLVASIETVTRTREAFEQAKR